jgi:branched-chain amino acid transport system substrate-binding protein
MNGKPSRRILSRALVPLLLLAACDLPAATQGTSAVRTGSEIRIGAPLSLTGSLAVEGALARQGYDFWQEWVNAGGGIEVAHVRHPVRIEYVDDQSKAEGATQAAERLIGEWHAQFLLGPYGSTATSAVAAVAERHEIPMIDTNGAAAEIFSHGYRYVFGVLSPAEEYLKGVLEMAALLRPKPQTIAVLSSRDSFSMEVAAGVVEYAPTKGMTVVFNEVYPSGSTDLYAPLERAGAAQPEIVLNSGHLVEAVALNKAAKDLRLGAKVYAYSVGPATPDFVRQLGQDADYVLTGSQWTPQARYQQAWRLSVDQFVSGYKKKFGSGDDPDYHVAESTAGGLTLQRALETAGSLDPQAVRERLASLDMNTFFGRVKFDSRGANTYKPMVVEQIQQGKHLAVWPPELASTTPLYPAPSWTERAGPLAAVLPAALPNTGHPPGG